MESSVQVLVVDDDVHFRTFIGHVLTRAGLQVGEAHLGEEALELAAAERPSAVILDVCLADMDGFEVCRELHDRFGDGLPIVFVSGTRMDAHDRVAGLLLGGDDYLMKPIDPDQLLARLRRLLRSNGGASGARRVLRDGLTARELEVLQLLAQGRDSTQIAEELVISQKTVASHLQRVMAKLGVRNRAQAVARAYEDGLLNRIPDVTKNPPARRRQPGALDELFRPGSPHQVLRP